MVCNNYLYLLLHNFFYKNSKAFSVKKIITWILVKNLCRGINKSTSDFVFENKTEIWGCELNLKKSNIAKTFRLTHIHISKTRNIENERTVPIHLIFHQLQSIHARFKKKITRRRKRYTKGTSFKLSAFVRWFLYRVLNEVMGSMWKDLTNWIDYIIVFFFTTA